MVCPSLLMHHDVTDAEQEVVHSTDELIGQHGWWYEANGQPLHNHGWEVGGGVIRDVTLVREQRRVQDEFLSLDSHELRTPLTSIRRYLNVRRTYVQSGNDERAVRDAMQGQWRQLTALVCDLMDAARLRSMSPPRRGMAPAKSLQCDIFTAPHEQRTRRGANGLM